MDDARPIASDLDASGRFYQAIVGSLESFMAWRDLPVTKMIRRDVLDDVCIFSTSFSAKSLIMPGSFQASKTESVLDDSGRR